MTFAEMKNIDSKTVDPGKLTDIADVTVNTRLPLPERLADYLDQIGNPYCFRCGNVVVKIAFADTTITFEDALEQFIRQRQLAEHTRL